MLSPNTILRDCDRIIREFGHGGMGAVYWPTVSNMVAITTVYAWWHRYEVRSFSSPASFPG